MGRIRDGILDDDHQEDKEGRASHRCKGGRLHALRVPLKKKLISLKKKVLEKWEDGSISITGHGYQCDL